jgi:hypothetical protein
MSLNAFQKRPVYGPARPSKLNLMGIRFVTEPPEGGGGGGSFTPPASQEDLDKLINKATAKVHAKYEGHDELKTKADRADELEAELAKLTGKPEPKQKPKDGDTPPGLSQEDVDKRIKEAIDATRAEERAALALERATDSLDKALRDRTFEPSKLLNLDRTQFVKDGAVDADAIKDWVEKNSAEGPKKRPFDPGQGQRDATAGGGSVQAGKDLYDQRHTKKSTT